MLMRRWGVNLVRDNISKGGRVWFSKVISRKVFVIPWRINILYGFIIRRNKVQDLAVFSDVYACIFE